MATFATLRDLTDALIETAKKEDKLKEVTTDIISFFKIISTSDELKNILSSSAYKINERKQLVKDIADRYGFEEITKNFISLVLELRKFEVLLTSQEPIIRKLRKVSGTVMAEITSAEPLSDSDLKRIEETLIKLTGSEIEVVTNVDPGILGGIITKIEDRVYDGSLKTQLERIRGALTTP